jgi:NHLM bacteriocin system ABC transporter peptidase/ATP-binding protein
MEAVECGAASLAIVLGYFGRFVPLEELRIACGVSRDGSNAKNVAQAARAYGLEVKAFRKEPEALQSLTLPLVVFWEFRHFLVVEGFGKDKVFLNDPATGPRTVTYAQFDRGFTGVVLTFEKGETFQPGGERPTLIETLRDRITSSRPALLYVLLAGLALALPGAATPIITKVFVDQVLVHGVRDWAALLLGGLGITALLRAILTYLQHRMLLRWETHLALSMSGKFFWHVLRLPYVFYTQRYAGEVGQRVMLNDTVATLLSDKLTSALLNLLTALLYALLMAFYDIRLTLIVLLFGGANVATLQLVSRLRKDLNQRVLQERGMLMATTMYGLQMIEHLKATGSERDYFVRWAGIQARLTDAEQRLATPTHLLSAAPILFNALNTAVLLGMGGYRVMSGTMSVGTLIALQSLMISFLAPIKELVQLGAHLQDLEGNLKRIDDVVQADLDPMLTQEPDELPEGTTLTGHLEIRNLSFGYSRLEAPLIEDFNLTIKPGSRVALIGGSGSGKSTVARIVAGLFAPWEGEILLDGRPTHAYPRSVLVNSLAMVEQDIMLFEGTVSENITLWDSNIPRETVIRAAKDACIHEEITQRPGAYASHVAEGGANFSGGQRQRLEIARALARNPVLLVLDEATSALDPITEQQIDDHIRRRGCTCLIVAHRLSTIRDCDEIIVMEDGKIVQRGTHAEMSRVEGHYARLLEIRTTDRKRHLLDFA